MNKMLSAVIGTLFSLTLLNASVTFVLDEDKILNERAVAQIEELAGDLFEKSGIFAGVFVIDSLKKYETINEASQYFVSTIPVKSYAFIFLVKQEHKVDIFQSQDVKKDFDKEEILSPYPNKGTIIPILVNSKGKDIYSAAILNGYLDMVEKISSSNNIKLSHNIANSNKIIIDTIRFFVYGSIVLVFIVWLYRRYFKVKHAK